MTSHPLTTADEKPFWNLHGQENHEHINTDLCFLIEGKDQLDDAHQPAKNMPSINMNPKGGGRIFRGGKRKGAAAAAAAAEQQQQQQQQQQDENNFHDEEQGIVPNSGPANTASKSGGAPAPRRKRQSEHLRNSEGSSQHFPNIHFALDSQEGDGFSSDEEELAAKYMHNDGPGDTTSGGGGGDSGANTPAASSRRPLHEEEVPDREDALARVRQSSADIAAAAAAASSAATTNGGQANGGSDGGPSATSTRDSQNRGGPSAAGSRRRSSIQRRDTEEGRRSIMIAAERRAEAKAALAAGQVGSGSGILYANPSNHSTASLQNSVSSFNNRGEIDSKPSGEDADRGPAPLPPPREKIQKVDSKRGLSVESQQKTEATSSAVTDVGDSVSTNGTHNKGAGTSTTGGDKGDVSKDAGHLGDGGQDHDGDGGRSATDTTVSMILGDKPTMLQRTCLNPNYSLRNQLYLSFGTMSLLAVLFVVLTSIITLSLLGNQVRSSSRQNLQSWAKLQLGHSSRKAADTVTWKLSNFDGLASILMETVKDRFVGYPDDPGYADDSNVPFQDHVHDGTVLYKYPLQSDPLPLDWQLVPNVNTSNQEEHLQERASWYERGTGANNNTILLSTASAMYRFQGNCDPSITDPNDKRYYPDCTAANNDAAVGGVVQPTETAGLIGAKAADLNFVLKPLFEYHSSARTLGYYFANSGAGSIASYPHEMRDGRSSYTSGGCDWMAEPNPLDPSRPIGTQDMINRCHPEGDSVNGREYNPLERGWCREQALNPGKTQNVGPYLDAFKEGLWLMTFGRAVYDRVTNEFIACTVADVGVDQIEKIIAGVKIGETSEVSLLRWDERGTVVASPRWNSSSATSATSILDEDLGFGIDEMVFGEIKSLVDFSKPWDPMEVRARFEQKLIYTEDKLVSAFPIPVPPDEYDPDYRPEFLVIALIDVGEVFRALDEMDTAFSESVAELIRNTLIVGFVGMAVVLVVIYLVGLYLTRPLQGMNRVGDQIVDTFGLGQEKSIDYSKAGTLRCSPKTEISDLAKEFYLMVSNFSGTGTAKIVKQKFTEVLNPFSLFGEFRDLYDSRRDEYFPYIYKESNDPVIGISSLLDYERSLAQGTSPFPHRLHFGQNLKERELQPSAEDVMSQVSQKKRKKRNSPLFRWIIVSIMTPLLLTITLIAALVTYEIIVLFPNLVQEVQDAFIGLETQALATTVDLRASFAAEVMEHAIRDLHLLTRVASWLLFGALQRSDAFPELITGAETCKSFPNDGSCPLMQDPQMSPCDCQWNDKWGHECNTYDTDSRYLQRAFYEGQIDDVWPNGDRNFTSFPLTSSTAENTSWWVDVHNLPGSEKDDLAEGFATTYDRVRMLATLAVLQIPLYNYGSSASSGRPLATYVAFEADGMFSGYTGCKHTHAQYAHWKSSESNGAANLRPELCPLGKYGYDPRCRGWYETGKMIALEGGNPLHVTAPYPFASGETAQSSTLPLVDPKSGEHVGQALVDFLPEDIVVSLRPENTPLADKGFPILITAQPDSFGADTVVGPGYSIEDGERYPIGDLVLPNDCANITNPKCSKRRAFESILVDMRDGKTDSTTFERTTAEGETEKVYFAFAPVISKDFAPKDSSDFSRGVDSYQSLIFSLAVAEPESGFLKPFQERIDVNRSVNVALAILLSLIVIAAIIVAYITGRVTVSITKPLTELLELVKSVNRSDYKGDLPQLQGGSREVAQVYGTFERLYKVILVANSAFFAGDLDKAYVALSDALTLFTQLDNRKAIAVANNNLGITMLTMYRTMKSLGKESLFDMRAEEIIERGTLYFNQAIALGEEALDRINEEEGWSKNYLIFMQQLSNRYFNRAMFFLSVREDHIVPEEAERQGIKDLTVTRELDTEVTENGAEAVFEDDESARFALVLSRIRGLLILMGMSYPDDWGIEELFEEAIMELSEAISNPHHAIFRDVGAAGMMQQLDADLIEFVEVDRDGIIMAARIGIRMLVEDEYVLTDAAQKAAMTLLHYLDVVEEAGIPLPSASETRTSLRKYLTEFSSLLECPDDEDPQRHMSRRQSTRGDVTMEMF